MYNTNAYLMQEKIKQKGHVTVPWLQSEYDFDYKEAKEILAYMIERGWLKAEPDGIKYEVIKSNCCLRRLVRNEVDGLIEDLGYDSASVILCIQSKEMHGATLDEIEQSVRCDEDETREIIDMLTEHRIIYKFNDLYFLTVSRKTVSVLCEVARGRHRNPFSGKSSGKSEDIRAIRNLFDELFDE